MFDPVTLHLAHNNGQYVKQQIPLCVAHDMYMESIDTIARDGFTHYRLGHDGTFYFTASKAVFDSVCRIGLPLEYIYFTKE